MFTSQSYFAYRDVNVLDFDPKFEWIHSNIALVGVYPRPSIRLDTVSIKDGS